MNNMLGKKKKEIFRVFILVLFTLFLLGVALYQNNKIVNAEEENTYGCTVTYKYRKGSGWATTGSKGPDSSCKSQTWLETQMKNNRAWYTAEDPLSANGVKYIYTGQWKVTIENKECIYDSASIAYLNKKQFPQGTTFSAEATYTEIPDYKIEVQLIDNIAHGSGTASDVDNGADGFTKTFSTPPDIPDRYEFLYWDGGDLGQFSAGQTFSIKDTELNADFKGTFVATYKYTPVEKVKVVYKLKNKVLKETPAVTESINILSNAPEVDRLAFWANKSGANIIENEDTAEPAAESPIVVTEPAVNMENITTVTVYAVLDGEQGANGKDGINGKDGVDGKDGKDGQDGKDGKQGLDGINGRDGLNGINGIDGRDGINGTNGIDGKNGTNGLNGYSGNAGRNGRDGINGKDGTVTFAPCYGSNEEECNECRGCQGEPYNIIINNKIQNYDYRKIIFITSLVYSISLIIITLLICGTIILINRRKQKEK